jgi:hypothetical protein
LPGGDKLKGPQIREAFVPGKDFAGEFAAAPGPPVNWQGLLGYLNFAEGRPDARFQAQFHSAFEMAAELARGRNVRLALADLLDEQLTALQRGGAPAFREVEQARAAIHVVLRELPRTYRRHHTDLLAPLDDDDLFTPFFLARACEAVLATRVEIGAVSAERLAAEAVARLNDFVGYRPVPVLENKRGDVYDHERFRPVPLYLKGVGVAAGPYKELVRTALQRLAGTDFELLEEAQFEIDLLDELAMDPRPYDHNQPANRRPNHVFGEWDPHLIDNHGRYRRFVVRKDTLDGLLAHVEAGDPAGRNDRLFDAAAVMAGTTLMASALCGRGPMAHDSGVTLSTRVPQIARLRDQFYKRLLAETDGPNGERIRRDAESVRQPLGSTRQHLNQLLARRRALQLQERHLAILFAALGYPAESRGRAAAIATASVRLAAEARSLITSAELCATHDPSAAGERLTEADAVIRRGIACGALADPWCMLGFQGLYPLFQAREDSIHDPRVDELLGLVGDMFAGYARAIGEAAARGRDDDRDRLVGRMRSLASWWDQFASYEVGDLPHVHGGEAAAAAEHVADALARWRGRATGPGAPSDLAFWRKHLDGFRTPAAFARVVTALLDRGERPAALGLLIAWLGSSPTVALGDGDQSFHALVRRWAEEASAGFATADRPAYFRRFFEMLEANAEDAWNVPSLRDNSSADEPDDIFEAAYEGVTFRDSADDGTEGAVAGDAPQGGDFRLEHDAEQLNVRLQFLATVADLWRIAVRHMPNRASTNDAWLASARWNRGRLEELLDELHALAIPAPPVGFEGAVEYDQRRAIKEQVTEAALSAAVATDRAIRALSVFGEQPPADHRWESLAVEAERQLSLGEREGTRAAVGGLLPQLRQEPLLYVPLAAGGHPRHVFRARAAQAILYDLMERLPSLGLLRETFAAEQTARAMEQASPPEGRKVTEFDRLFPVGLQSSVNAVLDVAATGELAGADLWAALKRLTDPYLVLWVEHSQTLRLSVLESVQSPVEWERVRGFVERYGSELFTAGFLNLANLRSVLHRGISEWLDELPRLERPPEKLLADLDGTLPRTQAVRLLEIILQAVVENYDEYRDYNTTTTQSDYGENLFVLLDFLRLKAAYERDNWRVRPLVIVHEVLCRRDRVAEAASWEIEIADYTREHADRHLTALAELESRHGLKLRTVGDRLRERFIASLAVERMCALLGPARRPARGVSGAASDESVAKQAFDRLLVEVDRLAADPTGVGLEVPGWIRRLESEFERLRHEPKGPTRRPSNLTGEQIRSQLGEDWNGRPE